jgi:hypothetical protein
VGARTQQTIDHVVVHLAVTDPNQVSGIEIQAAVVHRPATVPQRTVSNRSDRRADSTTLLRA